MNINFQEIWFRDFTQVIYFIQHISKDMIHNQSISSSLLMRAQEIPRMKLLVISLTYNLTNDKLNSNGESRQFCLAVVET